MFITFACLLGLLLPSLSFAAPPLKPLSQKIRVLLVTGGHPFEKEPFFKLFQDNPDITYQAVEHPNAHALLKAEAAKQYDVIVTYDFNQTISEEAKADFVARLKDGKGLVVLHHAIAAYPDLAGILEYHRRTLLPRQDQHQRRVQAALGLEGRHGLSNPYSRSASSGDAGHDRFRHP